MIKIKHITEKCKETYKVIIKGKLRSRKKIKIKEYSSLAPRDDIENNASIEMLKQALKDKRNKNIALSGKYGAGKSSIVLSALKKEKFRVFRKEKFKPLYISLGMLGIENEDVGEDIEKISRTIEKGIIQQIIYKEKSNKFPASKIKRIPYINKEIIFFIILAIVVYKLEIAKKIITDCSNILVSKVNYIWLIFYRNPNNFKFINFCENVIYLDKIIKLIALLVIIYFFTKYMTNIIRKYSLKNIKLMFFETNEIEVENIEESLINKYMDELVYFFEMTKYNIVVIEDLDRFMVNEKLKPKILIIFQKLKELNQILNSSKLLNRRITFLYVMRDDLFENEEERTKFFDFIVPKIPEISNYNSYAKLKKIFYNDDISDKFLQDISLHINDYRVIKNLKNEFDLYTQEITGEGIVKEKLLGMITLKNLRPKEYEKLIKEEGELYKYFKNKKDLYKKQEEKFEKEIAENKKLIKELEKENIESLKDLKYLALGSIACLNTGRIYSGLEKNSFLSDDFNIEDIEKNKINIKNHNGYYFSEEELFEQFGGKEEFIKRARRIKDKNNYTIKGIKEKNKEIEKKIKEIYRMSISELMKIEDENIEDSENIKNKEKIDEFEMMMLKNGYIDENYKDYCFKFEETEKIKRKDFIYILNVRKKANPDYELIIANPDYVIKELNEQYFESKSIWNYSILDELIREGESQKLDNFIKTLLEINKDTYEFISGYIQVSRNKKEILKLLYRHKKETIYDFFKFEQCSDEITELILNIPEILTEEILTEELSQYIATRTEYIWFELNEKVKKSLILLNVKFSRLSDVEDYIEILTRKEKEFIDFVYENDLYEINDYTINSIFLHKGFKTIEFNECALSIILRSDKLEKLKKYILENKEQFIRKCLINTNGIGNKIEDIIECLNTWDIEYELKNIIVSKIHGKIDNIQIITDTAIYPSILNNEKMTVSWENIHVIYCVTKKITPEIILYIEKNIDILEKMNIIFANVDSEIEINIDFRKKLAKNNNIKYDVFKRLIPKLNIYLNIIEENEIENKRLELLIKEKIIKLNVQTFEVVKNQDIEILAEFVSLNIDNFIKYIYELDLDTNSIEEIIMSEKIKYRYKTLILSKINRELLSDISMEYIINNYQKNKISSISVELKIYIFSSHINIERKIDLLIKEIDKKISTTIIEEYIRKLPNEYCKIGNIYYNTSSIPRTKINEKLIEKLENILNISKKVTKNKIVIYNKKNK